MPHEHLHKSTGFEANAETCVAPHAAETMTPSGVMTSRAGALTLTG